MHSSTFDELFASENSTLQQSQNKVDFHILFHYKLYDLFMSQQSRPLSRNSLWGTPNCCFTIFLKPHLISYTSIDLGKIRKVVHDWFN